MTDQIDPSSALEQQPHAIVERDGVRYTILGTAHVSRASVDAVEQLANSGRFDAIAVELDAMRLRNMTDSNAMQELDLFRILREGKTGLVAANLALAAYQRRLSEQLGVEPGAELKAAARVARERDLPLQLIDRDVGITLKRAYRGLGFWGRIKLMTGLGISLFDNEQVGADEIERLKEGDILESSFGEFAAQSPPIFEALIKERDCYMAARLREANRSGDERTPAPGGSQTLSGDERTSEVLVVIGAGHLKGLSQHLRDDTEAPASVRERLESSAKASGIPWISLLIAALVLGSFAWGYWHGGAHLGTTLVLTWIVLTAVGGALGCIAAGGHPLSVLAAAVWSPWKPFHPGIASGTVSGLVEAWARKPKYQDFMNLRDDVGSVRGWYRNRVSRVFLNFFLTCMGTIAGEV
ncbi:MAG TPA: TraB/GumN family protein, partial [Xanthomonadaceae bacterium]|nr:TraB/GumN family protein [Xanthomonadaceae bacterium]